MRRGHAVAAAAALALLLIMAMDWYGTVSGDEARRIEALTEDSSGAAAGEVERRLNEDAREVAEQEESNAWQVDGTIDRVILVLMLAAAALTLLTVIARAAGARPTRGIGPGGLGALLGTVAAVLVAYRILQEPGFDQATTIKLGAPLGVVALAVMTLGMVSALRADAEPEPEADTGQSPREEGAPA